MLSSRRASAQEPDTHVTDAEVLDGLFRQAVAAIDAGDPVLLERLLAEHPRLVRDRLESPGEWLRAQIGPALDGFFKHPYLLWFVTEDAVRTGQLSAKVADVARVIIRAARRAGVTDLQQQLDSTLHFTVCSPIGREDGRQLELLDVLIDAGASIDGGPVQALICYNFVAAQHLVERGARLTLPAALCLERWSDVDRLAPEASATDKQVVGAGRPEWQGRGAGEAAPARRGSECVHIQFLYARHTAASRGVVRVTGRGESARRGGSEPHDEGPSGARDTTWLGRVCLVRSGDAWKAIHRDCRLPFISRPHCA